MTEHIRFDDNEKWVEWLTSEQYEKTVGYTGKVDDIEISMFVGSINDGLFVALIDQISGAALTAFGMTVEEMFKCQSKAGMTEVFIDKMMTFNDMLNDDVRNEIERKRYENAILPEPKELSLEEKIGMGIIK